MKTICATALIIAAAVSAFGIEIDYTKASVQTLCGDGTRGFNDGVWTNAQIYNPIAFVPNGTGLVFFDDRQDFNQVPIRIFSNEDRAVITSTNTLVVPYSSFSHSFYVNDSIWLAAGKAVIKQSMKDGVRSLILFSQISGYLDTNLARARFVSITGFAQMPDGAFLALDSGNKCFRRISISEDSVTTFGPSGATTVFAKYLAAGDGGYYFTDKDGTKDCLRKLSPDGSIATIRTFSTQLGNMDGPIETAGFLSLSGMSWLAPCPDGSIVFVDQFGTRARIRRLKNGIVSTIIDGNSVIRDGSAVEASVLRPERLTVATDGTIYFLDDLRIRKISPLQEVVGSAVYATQATAMTIEGTIGRTYRVETMDTIGGEWSAAGQVTLMKSPQKWFDESPLPKRFYRAVLLP
jgi:hypothetical protein